MLKRAVELDWQIVRQKKLMSERVGENVATGVARMLGYLQEAFALAPVSGVAVAAPIMSKKV